MLLGKTHLWNRLTGRQRRNYASPSQSIFTVFPDIRQPPVPTPAQRNLSVGPRGQGREPKRVVKHLDVNAERIHMAQSLMYIGKLTGFYWRRYLPDEFSEMLLGFFFVRRRKFRAQVLAVEKPVLSLGILGRTDESGTIFLFVAL